MKTGVLITARLGSTRLKQKHLKKVNGVPILQYLIDRINFEFKNEIEYSKLGLVISTGNKEMNLLLEKETKNCKIFYGNDNNIPLRHLETANHFHFENIISVDGDDILVSTKAMRKVFEQLEISKNFVKTEGLPLGLNAIGYTKEFLEVSLKNQSYDLLETGWGRIFDESELSVIRFESEDRPFLRFTLDYDEDFQFFEEIINEFDENIITISDEEIVKKVLEKEIYKKNEKIALGYWDNFYKHIEMEEEKNESK